jgi:DNA-binding transcriptional ArsR family regulator
MSHTFDTTTAENGGNSDPQQTADLLDQAPQQTADLLDPLIHAPTRLKIVATLAALPDGDALSVTRLQDMIRLPPGRLITHLRELGHAGYVRTGMTGGGRAQATAALSRDGRVALDRYTAVLRQLPGVARGEYQAAGLRVGDADRDAAAAALGEHFAHGRLTLDELNARLDATLTAITHGELSQAALDLPDLTVFPARVSFSRGKRARRSGFCRERREPVE